MDVFLLSQIWNATLDFIAIISQLMVTGPNGRLGRNAASRVVADNSLGREHAPILLLNMAAEYAVEKTKKCNLAMISIAQVNKIRFVIFS